MTLYTDASSEMSQDNSKDNSNDNTKRNRKTQALSALLSATALGVFLEGCGGDTPASAPPPPSASGSESDPFLATAGADTFTGKAGADWVSYAGSSSGVMIGLSDDSTTPAIVGRGAVGDTLTGIQNIIGTGHDDIFLGNGGANSLRGGVGDDTIHGGAGDDIIDGGAGVDTLKGDAGSDIIEGGAGLDMLDGGTDAGAGTGADTSKDTLSYANEEHLTSLGVAVSLATSTVLDYDTSNTRDTIAGFENVIGSRYSDKLTGDEFANRLEGGAGADTLDGGAGVDTLKGGAGVDTYIFRVGDGTDSISDVVGDTMTLRFEGSQYESDDFIAGNALFGREGDDLVISIDKDTSGSNPITDKVMIGGAYDSDSDTGTGNAAFTIAVEYGSGGSFTEVTLANSYWHGLTA